MARPAPPPSPCTTRPASSTSTDCAESASSEPAMNSVRPARSAGRGPIRSEVVPYTSCDPANEMMNRVTASWRVDSLAPNSSAMVGNDGRNMSTVIGAMALSATRSAAAGNASARRRWLAVRTSWTAMRVMVGGTGFRTSCDVLAGNRFCAIDNMVIDFTGCLCTLQEGAISWVRSASDGRGRPTPTPLRR